MLRLIIIIYYKVRSPADCKIQRKSGENLGPIKKYDQANENFRSAGRNKDPKPPRTRQRYVIANKKKLTLHGITDWIHVTPLRCPCLTCTEWE